AVVKVRNPGDHHLLAAHPMSREEVAISFASYAEPLVAIRQTGGGGAGDPPRQPAKVLDERKSEPFGVGHSLLDQHQRVALDIVGDAQILAAKHQIVLMVAPAEVQRQPMAFQISEASFHQWSASDRHVQEAAATACLEPTVDVTRAEEVVADSERKS